MRVCGRRVLIKRDPTPEKVGLIFIPDRAKKLPKGGIVAVVGEQVTTVKVGERVLFGAYAGVPIDVNGEPHLCIWDRDVIAVLDDA